MGEFGRRGFLKLLGLGTVAAAATTLLPEFDPEFALWRPGAKTFFLPSQQPVLLATVQETVAVTGPSHMLRIKVGQDILLVSEKMFVESGGIQPMILSGPAGAEVHFDNGTIAYLQHPKSLSELGLEDIRKLANQHQASIESRRRVPDRLHRRAMPQMIAQERERQQHVLDEMSGIAQPLKGPADKDRLIITDQD